MLPVLAKVLTVLFLIGVAGSAVVVIFTFVEDLRDAVEDDAPKTAKSADDSNVSAGVTRRAV